MSWANIDFVQLLKRNILACVSFFYFAFASQAQIPKGFLIGKPIPLGHSHNDYIQEVPLWEALRNGFTSIEIDVYTAPDAVVRVSHLPFSLRHKPSFEELYLRPLKEWIDKNGGRVFPDTDVVLTLMVDLKGNGAETYPLLKETLLPYRDYMTIYGKDSIHPGPVRIMLSGNRPLDLLAADKEQWFSLDAPLGADYSGKNVRVDRESAPFAAHFKKRSNGSFNDKEKEKLRNFVKHSNEKGHELRFWAAGNNAKRWQSLAEAGVTVINADRLSRFRVWLNEYLKNKKQ